MEEHVLTIHGLHKRFGRIKAVQDLSLEVPKGSVFGLLGPNGSGKTTTLGMILDVIPPNAGNYSWFGNPPSKHVRKKIGAILEHPVFYPYLSAAENLKITAVIKNVKYSRIPGVLEKVGLAERANDPFKTYSLGMKQRLAIASALLSDPVAMILDEPTNGLDPQGIAEVRGLISRIASEGKTIILASHLLDEVQKVCTHFTVLRKGKKIYTGRVDESFGKNQVVLVASPEKENLAKTLENFTRADNIETFNGKFKVKLKEGIGGYELNQYLVDQRVIVSELQPQGENLENKFLQILKEHDD